MGFKNNYSDVNENSIKPIGDYECVIHKVEERTTRNGKVGLNIQFLIRSDVNQKYQRGYIFHTLWKRKEPTDLDKQVNGYGFNQVMQLGKASGLPEGKDYDNLTQFNNDLINKPVRITLNHREYNGNLQEEVKYINKTKFPLNGANIQQPKSNDGFEEMPVEDDLPF